VLDHTADCRVRVWASSIKNIFILAGKGLSRQIVDNDRFRPLERRRIQIEGESLEEGLLFWLREILFIFERDGIIFSQFLIDKDKFSASGQGNVSFSSECRGERVDATRHGICKEIKAVTRHGLSIRKKGNVWEAEYLLDL